MQYYAFRVYQNWTFVYFTNLALKQHHAWTNDEKAEMEDRYRSALFDSLTSFLSMHAFGQFAQRTWIFLHIALSSAIILGLINQGTKEEQEEICIQQRALLKVFANSSNETLPWSHGRATFGPTTPYANALQALSSMCHAEDESDSAHVNFAGPVAGMKRKWRGSDTGPERLVFTSRYPWRPALQYVDGVYSIPEPDLEVSGVQPSTISYHSLDVLEAYNEREFLHLKFGS